MDKNKYKDLVYVPSVKEIEKEFRCRVPLQNTVQQIIIDGECNGSKGFDFSVPNGKVLEELTQIIAVRRNPDIQSLHYPVNIHIGQRGEAKLLYCAHTLTACPFKTTEDININIADGAVLDMVIMQNEHEKSNHLSGIRIEIGEGAVLRFYLITLHGGEIVNRINVNLNGKNINTNLSGLYFANGEQRLSTEINVAHNFSECYSNQLFKGILEGNAVSHFKGTVYVAKDAQKTEAYQANNNILASDTAKAYTQPHLEIYADDVKCSHGATVGRLDETELFYMRSRGIAYKEAVLLQQQAFASAVLEKISNIQLRERLMDLVERRLRGEFSNCSNCSKHCC